MTKGDQFNIKGYDIVAHAEYAEEGGEVLVLNNNSSHYLVAVRRGDVDDMAQLEASHSYGGGEYDAFHAYRSALADLLRIVLSR